MKKKILPTVLSRKIFDEPSWKIRGSLRAPDMETPDRSDSARAIAQNVIKMAGLSTNRNWMTHWGVFKTALEPAINKTLSAVVFPNESIPELGESFWSD